MIEKWVAWRRMVVHGITILSPISNMSHITNSADFKSRIFSKLLNVWLRYLKNKKGRKKLKYESPLCTIFIGFISRHHIKFFGPFNFFFQILKGAYSVAFWPTFPYIAKSRSATTRLSGGDRLFCFCSFHRKIEIWIMWLIINIRCAHCRVHLHTGRSLFYCGCWR